MKMVQRAWTLLILIMMLSSVDATTLENLDLSPGSTAWFPIMPTITNNNISGVNGKSAIRARLTGIEQVTHRDFLEKKSPSLELLWDDLGNKKYLNHSTLKHSIQEMADLSSSDDEGQLNHTDCGAMTDGPKVFFHTCPGDLIVVTLAGSMKMTCLEIEKRVFYGPVLLKNVHCQQSLMFELDCETRLRKQLTKAECNAEEKNVVIIIEAILIVLTVIIFYITIAWICGMHKGVKLSSERIPLTRHGWEFTADYDEFTNDDGVVCQKRRGGESEVNMIKKQFKISSVKLLILFLLCRPINVKSYEIVSSYDATLAKYSYKVMLDDSEEIILGPSTLKRELVAHTSQLTKLFTTAIWELEHREEYYCQWYKCEAVSVCGMGTLPFISIGDLAQSLFKFSNPDRAYYTCQKLQGYCTFGNGCKLLSFQVNYKDDNLFDVYSIGQGGQHGGEVTPPIGCVVDQIRDESTGQLNNQLVIRKRTGEIFLCPREFLSMKPELGMIGDLQILSTGKFLFATNEIHCVADHNDRSLCRYQKSAMAYLSSLCTKHQDLPFPIDIDVDGSYISWAMHGQATVDLKCDRPINFKRNKHQCSNVRIRVWEVAHLDASLLLSFQAEATSSGSSFILPKIVHASSRSFPCDGKVHYTTLYDLRSLNSSGLEYAHEVIPYNGIDTMQKDHFSNEDPDDGSDLGFLSKIAKWIPSLSITTIIIIVVVILLCLCIMKK